MLVPVLLVSPWVLVGEVFWFAFFQVGTVIPGPGLLGFVREPVATATRPG
jgi:hypothetical protein